MIGLKSEYGAYAKSFHARLPRDDQKIGITFEEYLSDALEKDVGPFVALGSPEDCLAPERRLAHLRQGHRLDGEARPAGPAFGHSSPMSSLQRAECRSINSCIN